jgi:HlyD family secretion protein
MKKKLFLIIGAVIVLAVFVILALNSSGEKRTTVSVETVGKGEMTSIVTATGRVKAQADIEISADVMGRIDELTIEEGDYVKTGQLLVKIDDKSRRMDVAQAKGSLLSAKSANVKAKIEYEREQKLFDKGGSSQAQLDIMKNLYDQSEANLQIAQASYDRNQDQLAKCTIRSPMDGVVTRLNSEQGENVVIGTMNNPGTVIMVISDLSAIEIEAEVDETDVAYVDTDQDVEITLDAFPDTTFKGKVIHVGNSATATAFGSSDQITNFMVKILIVDTVENIKPGMTASVDITTDYREDALKVPAGSVVMRPEGTGVEEEEEEEKEAEGDEDAEIEKAIAEKDKKDIDGVFMVAEGKAKFTPVETGIRDQQHVEITSGLSEGDSIIVGPYRMLRTIKHDTAVNPEESRFGKSGESDDNS